MSDCAWVVAVALRVWVAGYEYTLVHLFCSSTARFALRPPTPLGTFVVLSMRPLKRIRMSMCASSWRTLWCVTN